MSAVLQPRERVVAVDHAVVGEVGVDVEVGLRAGGRRQRDQDDGERERADGQEPAEGGHRPTVVPTRARRQAALPIPAHFPHARVASLTTSCGCSSPAPPGSPAATSPPTARPRARGPRARPARPRGRRRPARDGARRRPRDGRALARLLATPRRTRSPTWPGASSVGRVVRRPARHLGRQPRRRRWRCSRPCARPRPRRGRWSSRAARSTAASPVEDLPVGPDTPLRPLSPYGASKAAADLAAGQYRAAYGLPAHARARLQPRRPRPGPALRAAQRRPPDRPGRARGPRARSRCGSATSTRGATSPTCATWSAPTLLILERGDPDAVYLACSGRSRPVRELIEGLAPLARIPVTFASDAGAAPRRRATRPLWFARAPARRHRMDARDPDRDDPGRHPRLVARARRRRGPRVRTPVPRALITGITGQDGSYLAELLLGKGYDVWGVVRRSSTESYERIEHLRDRLRFAQADLLDQPSLTAALQEAEPDEVYNLAAQSFVPTSWTQPVLTAEFTAVGVTRLLEAIRQVDPSIRFYQASSSEMFGRVRRDAPERGHPVLPAQPLRRREGLRPLHHGQLPRVLRPLRLLGDPLQPRVAPPRPRVRDAQGHRRGGAHQARPERAPDAGEPRRPPRLGLRRRLRRGDVADAPAGASPRTTSWRPA